MIIMGQKGRLRRIFTCVKKKKARESGMEVSFAVTEN